MILSKYAPNGLRVLETKYPYVAQKFQSLKHIFLVEFLIFSLIAASTSTVI